MRASGEHMRRGISERRLPAFVRGVSAQPPVEAGNAFPAMRVPIATEARPWDAFALPADESRADVRGIAVSTPPRARRGFLSPCNQSVQKIAKIVKKRIDKPSDLGYNNPRQKFRSFGTTYWGIV